MLVVDVAGAFCVAAPNRVFVGAVVVWPPNIEFVVVVGWGFAAKREDVVAAG